MKWVFCIFLIGSCQSSNDLDCIILHGSRDFKASDITNLRTEAPARMTRNGASRLLFDVLRAEHVMNGSSKPKTLMKDRVLTYKSFVEKYPDPIEELKMLEKVMDIKKGSCYQSIK